MKDDRRPYAMAAILLPVALGFGLIYFYATGSLDTNSIVLVVVGMVLLVPLVGILVDLRDEGRSRRQEGSRLKRTYAGRRSRIDSSR